MFITPRYFLTGQILTIFGLGARSGFKIGALSYNFTMSIHRCLVLMKAFQACHCKGEREEAY